MSAQPCIAGMGVVSAIGNDLRTNFQSLCAEKAGIGEMTWLQSANQAELPVGEVKYSNEELVAATGFSSKLPRTAFLSSLAAREALLDAGWVKNNPLRTGFISANTVGGMDKTENFFKLFSGNKTAGKLADVVYHECGSVTRLVADD